MASDIQIIMEILGAEDMVKAVSYTHLDVYKRQLNNNRHKQYLKEKSNT